MKTTKKFIAVGLIFTILFSLAACGSSTNNPPPADLAETPVSEFTYRQDTFRNDREGIMITRHIGDSTRLRYPEMIEGMPVLGIEGDSSDRDKSKITFVYIPNSVTSIGHSAFRNYSGLTSIILPDGVTYIGRMAFENCTGLTNIIIPDGVTSIGAYAFANTGLTSIDVPDSVTRIEMGINRQGAFFNSENLTSATYKGVTYNTETNDSGDVDLPQAFYNAINGR
jgi:hypothetical protein